MLKEKETDSDLTQQVILSGIILFFIAVVQVGIEIFAAPLMTEEILDLEWVDFSCGSPAISFVLPEEPKPEKPGVSEEVWEYLGSLEAYSFKEAENYQFFVSAVKYMHFIKADAEGAARGAIEGMESERGITNLKFKQRPYNLGALSGIMQTGTYEENDEIFEFTSLFFTSKSNLWQVSISHRRGDVFGRKITEKILKSLRIDKA